jgi:hypothetical protein
MKPQRQAKPLPGARDVAGGADYVAMLRESHGRYARAAGETRRLVDDSMGATSLTELLHKSREDGTK